MIVGIAKRNYRTVRKWENHDTIVHALTTLLSDVPTSLVIIAMFTQFILNFFIPSGSVSINDDAFNGSLSLICYILIVNLLCSLPIW